MIKIIEDELIDNLTRLRIKVMKIPKDKRKPIIERIHRLEYIIDMLEQMIAFDILNKRLLEEEKQDE